MADYGYNIEHILMVDIIPDATVHKALNDINAVTAQRLQLASLYKGEAEKIVLVKKAEAEAEAKYVSGVGIAKQRQAITDGLREHPELLALGARHQCKRSHGFDHGHAVLRHQGARGWLQEHHGIHPSWPRPRERHQQPDS
ncbi:hypothetical protein BS78_02G355200 [Paspalum vaginatum]|nr:hypothetical protein BS78_02G355200 [Paspalum vaginatum]